MATRSEILELESDPLTWQLALFEPYVTDSQGRIVPPAQHHLDMWAWAWSIEAGRRPPPFVAIWPRGGAKSTNSEMATVALGARRRRRYAWYICETQDQADDHVATIAAMLESDGVAEFYPDLAARKVGKYGSSRGWRRNRLRTRQGYTVDALGLDSAARGVKLEEARPDLMIVDDVDDINDGPNTVDKKIRTLTKTIFGAGDTDSLAVLAVQNLIHPESIFARMATGRADWLTDRILSGPIPALYDFTYEHRRGRWIITSGIPSWVGQDLAACQAVIDTEGITAFLEERQHEVEAPAGGMFSHLDLKAMRAPMPALGELTKVVCWVDPAVTKSNSSDSQAIQIDGIHPDGTIYRLYSWEQRSTPLAAIKHALKMAATLHAQYVGIETDQGGETWASVFREARTAVAAELVAKTDPEPELAYRVERLSMREAKAGQGQEPKAERASKMLADYERPGLRLRHVLGTHQVLERALHRFPLTPPLDLVDAAYWAWADLREGGVFALAPGGDAEPDKAALEEEEKALREIYAAQRQSSVWR